MRLNWSPIRIILCVSALAAVTLVLFPGLRLTLLPQWLNEQFPLMRDWVALAAVLLFLIAIHEWRRQRRPGSVEKSAGQDPHTSLLLDRPIASGAEDAFGWDNLADVVANNVVLDPGAPSLVVAIEGPWGCGKSSLLYLVESKLRARSRPPVLVRFNPWVTSTVANLLDSLLEELVQEAISQANAPALVGALDSFRREVESARLTGVPLLIVQAGTALSRIFRHRDDRTSFLSRKQAVSDMLNGLDCPVIVVVDDLDRLPPDRIKEVFQVIRAAADFDRVCYLIAYDPRPVLAALEFGDQKGFGKEYKEKIVQLSVPFPRLPYKARKDFLRRCVLELAGKVGIRMTAADHRLLESALPRILRAVLTPRQAKIIANHAGISAAILKSEVSLAELLAFETLAVRFPELISEIRRQPGAIFGHAVIDEEFVSSDIGAHLDGTDRATRADEARKQLVGKSIESEADRTVAESILTFLFPTLPDQSDEDREAWGTRRLRDENNYLAMLYAGVRGELFSNNEADQFLYDDSDREALLDQHVHDGTIAGFLVFIRSRIIANQPVPQLESLVLSLISRARAVYEKEGADLSEAFAVLSLDLLLKAESEEQIRRQVLGRAVLHKDFLSPGHDLLVRVLRYRGMWDQGRWLGDQLHPRAQDIAWLPTADLDRLRSEWVEMVRTMPIELLVRREPEVIGILHRAGQLATEGYSWVQEQVGAWLAASDDNVREFAKLFPPGRSFSGSEKLVPAGMDLLGMFEKVEVPGSQIERLLEDCPSFGKRGVDAAR